MHMSKVEVKYGCWYVICDWICKVENNLRNLMKKQLIKCTTLLQTVLTKPAEDVSLIQRNGQLGV